jgi:endonuclease G
LVADGTPPALVKAALRSKTKVLCASAYVVQHSGITRTPLWSAEHLTRANVAAASALSRPKRNTFRADARLRKSDRAELKDYANSGYDRGHMAPSGDMPTTSAQHESFLLSNMVPQSPCLNEVLWQNIESAVRNLAAVDGELYIVTGPVFEGATLQQINDRVMVPTGVFKAIYDPAKSGAAAYVAPNDGNQGWKALSIAQLRDLTGIDVFPSLSAAMKDQLMPLPAPAPHGGCRLQ